MTWRWLERVVVGLDLCPFARAPLRAGRIRVVASRSSDPAEILAEILAEIEHIGAGLADTSLLVTPEGLADFDDQLDLLAAAEALLDELGLSGDYQLVSFHPDYRFADAPPGDPADWVNRAPHPLFHVLRGDDVARAAESWPDIGDLPTKNAQRLRALGVASLEALFAELRSPAAS